MWSASSSTSIETDSENEAGKLPDKTVMAMAKLNIAIKNKDIEEIIKICKENPDVINAYGYPSGPAIDTELRGSSLLHIACDLGSLKLVDFLLKQGADINAVNECGMTALHIACKNKNKNIVDRLLKENKININLQTTKTFNSALHLAVRESCAVIVDALVARPEIDLNLPGSQGYSPLAMAELNMTAYEGNISKTNDYQASVQIRNKLLAKGAVSVISGIYHKKLAEVANACGYSLGNLKGNCYTSSATVLDYLARKTSGVNQLNRLLAKIREESSIDELKIKITSALDTRWNCSRTTILDRKKDEISQQYQSGGIVSLQGVFTELDKIEQSRVVRKIIDDEYPHASSEQKKYLTHRLMTKLSNSDSEEDVIEIGMNDQKEYDLQLKNGPYLIADIYLDRAYTYLTEKITLSAIAFLAQKRIQEDIKKALGKDLIYLDVHDFVAALSVNAGVHSELIEENLRHFRMGLKGNTLQNCLSTILLTHSIEAEEMEYRKRAHTLGYYDKANYTSFLNSLIEQFLEKQIKHPVLFEIVGIGHAVSMAYLPEEQFWIFYNINDMENNFRSTGTVLTPISFSDTFELVDQLFSSYSFLKWLHPDLLSHQSGKLSIPMTVFGSREDALKLEQCFIENRNNGTADIPLEQLKFLYPTTYCHNQRAVAKIQQDDMIFSILESDVNQSKKFDETVRDNLQKKDNGKQYLNPLIPQIEKKKAILAFEMNTNIMLDKLATDNKTSNSETRLSQAVSYAFNAKKSDSKFFKCSDSIKGVVDIDQTYSNILNAIVQLDGKIYGEGNEVKIKMDGREKTIHVSNQVAGICDLLMKMKMAQKKEDQLKYLEEILTVGKRESSFWTCRSSGAILRHADVFQFFRSMNELLVVDYARMEKFVARISGC